MWALTIKQNIRQHTNWSGCQSKMRINVLSQPNATLGAPESIRIEQIMVSKRTTARINNTSITTIMIMIRMTIPNRGATNPRCVFEFVPLLPPRS